MRFYVKQALDPFYHAGLFLQGENVSARMVPIPAVARSCLASSGVPVTSEKRAIDQKLTDLSELRNQAHKGGGQNRIDQQHGRGKLTARERLAL